MNKEPLLENISCDGVDSPCTPDGPPTPITFGTPKDPSGYSVLPNGVDSPDTPTAPTTSLRLDSADTRQTTPACVSTAEFQDDGPAVISYTTSATSMTPSGNDVSSSDTNNIPPVEIRTGGTGKITSNDSANSMSPSLPRDTSETKLLVGDPMQSFDVTTNMIDPSAAGDIKLWNGVNITATDLIRKEKAKKEPAEQISDLYCCLRVWSVLGHFGLLVCLPLLLWLLLTRAGRELEQTAETSPLAEHHLWFTTPLALTSIFLVFSYILILCEACISPTRPYLANLMSLDHAGDYVRELRAAPPRIVVHVKCYHFEDRSRGMRGKSWKRVSFEERREFLFRRCHDVSGDLQRVDFPAGFITKLNMKRVFGFLDAETEEKYKMFRSSLIERNSTRDVYIEVDEFVEMDGVRDKACVYLDEQSRPTCLHYRFYWLSALAFLSCPFRYWFNSHTKYSSFTFIKLIGQ